jgi:hypothetical protein
MTNVRLKQFWLILGTLAAFLLLEASLVLAGSPVSFYSGLKAGATLQMTSLGLCQEPSPGNSVFNVPMVFGRARQVSGQKKKAPFLIGATLGQDFERLYGRPLKLALDSAYRWSAKSSSCGRSDGPVTAGNALSVQEVAVDSQNNLRPQAIHMKTFPDTRAEGPSRYLEAGLRRPRLYLAT